VAEPEPKGNGEPRKNGGEKPRKAAEKARGGIGLRQRLREKDPNAKRSTGAGMVEFPRSVEGSSEGIEIPAIFVL